jgi:pSer/pThr/pTyr-binding forkhead associated (FHA) protein
MMQGNDSFRLVVRRGPQPNQVYELNKDIVTLGRDITNDITINDPEVSRHHMRLTRGAGGFTIEDLGSTNGTFVNGQRLTGARPLRPGDMVGLGETVTLGYEAVSAAAPQGYGAEDQGMPVTAPNPVPRQQPMSPAPAPYSPPQQQQPQPQQYGGYNQAPAASYNAPPVAPQAPPGTGYDYDPYEVREEEPRSNTRWILIGCVGLSLFCCCGSLVGTLLIDSACAWDKVPILWQVIRMFGYGLNPGSCGP